MGYILLGHGGLDVHPAVLPPDMEIVALPRGTTLRFFADTGQQLSYGPMDLDGWDRLTAHLPALDCTRVTYNLTLEDAGDDAAIVLQNDPLLGGHELVRPGIGDIPGRIRLCAGTRTTCPTAPAQVARGMAHACDGIFGRPEFRGKELFWIACTSVFNADEAVLEAALDRMPKSVLLGTHPDHIPVLGASHLASVRQRNAANIARGEQASDHDYFIVGSTLFLGPDYGDGIRHYLTAVDDPHTSLYRVSALDDGTVVVGFWGIPPEWEDFVITAVGEFAPEARIEFYDSGSEESAESASGRSTSTSSASGDGLP
ncbi:hypothetical protein AB0N09_34460 [Streptomyces erythrochromogenes]|uniref:hypothetical protein n=1 Tax=Streptomyces erythrochromogenes TaxID=285574 RepID=UPI00343D0C5D